MEFDELIRSPFKIYDDQEMEEFMKHITTEIEKMAVRLADALLNELNKTNDN